MLKKLVLLVVAMSALVSGCVVYDTPPRPREPYYRGDRDRDGVPNRVDRDRDGDGVPNRVDRRPDDPRRY
jgi:hypothetical protein